MTQHPLEPTLQALGVAGTGALNLTFSPLLHPTTSSSVFQQPLDICHSFTSSQGGGREPLPAPYQHQLSEPCPPYPQQSFKQEYLDPLYEQLAVGQGGVNGHRYPGAGVVIKQEQTDFAYDSGKRCWGVREFGWHCWRSGMGSTPECPPIGFPSLSVFQFIPPTHSSIFFYRFKRIVIFFNQ